jgi:hypothetical protein
MFFWIATTVFVANNGEPFPQRADKIDNIFFHKFNGEFSRRRKVKLETLRGFAQASSREQ